jgi:exodeoxyribonuclease V alpha subunit
MNPSVLSSLIQPAFAMTVHKSQGSEYDEVLLILPQDDEHGLITKQLIYTAITRAKTQFTMIGSESVFKKAVKTILKRESGIK